MQLSDLGALGEFISALVVMITLIYLAIQMRQNTSALKNGQTQQFQELNHDVLAPLINSRDVAEMWVKGGQEFSSLDVIDQQRMVFFEWRVISAWNHYYHMRQQNLIDDHFWRELVFIFQTVGTRQSMQEAWRVWRGAYLPGFKEFMDQYLDPMRTAGAMPVSSASPQKADQSSS